MPFSLRFSSYPFRFQRSFSYIHSSRRKPSHFILCVRWVRQNRVAGSQFNSISTSSSLLPGLEDALMGYISGSKKATEVAHSVWQHVVQKGDTVIDATCGNGHDTLAMIKMVADDSGRGHVYGMDIQRAALENTSSFLDAVLDPVEKDHVKLFSVCHSRMEDIVPKDILVRLVAFNLGYLPGGDKTITTAPETTLLALQAASRILGPGGLISIVVYVGHPGGSKEFETVQDFASRLSVDNWVCCKFEMINRAVAPILVFLFRR